MKSFFKAFNQSLTAASRVMGENFTVMGTASAENGTEWEAIAIDEVTAESGITLGGKLLETGAVIYVSGAVQRNSGVTMGTVVVARGMRLRVARVGREGDDSVTLTCEPVGFATPRR